MVTWSPDVPNPNDVTPKWGRDSQPITQWQGDQSMGKLFEGFGNSLEIGVKGVDFAIKNDIDKKAYAAVDPERDAYTAALEGGLAAASGAPKGQAAEQLKARGMGNTNAPPQDIDRQLGYVQSIKDGADAGKFNDTYYKGRLIAAVKDLRAEYPGYREYIDKKVASITGFDPANAKITDLLTDLNNLVGKKDNTREHLMTDLRKYIDDIPGVADIMKKVVNGSMDVNAGYDWLGDKLGPIVQNKALKRELEGVQTKDALSANKGLNFMNNYGNTYVRNAATSFEDEVLATNPQLQEAVRQHNLGVKKLDTATLTSVAEIMNQRVQNVRDHLFMTFNDKGNGKFSPADLVNDPKKVNEYIDQLVAPLERQVQHVLKGDLSAATAVTRELNARKNDAVKTLLDDPKLAPTAIGLHAMKDVVGGENVLTKFMQNINLTKDQVGAANSYLQRLMIAAAQQGETPNRVGPITLRETVQKLQAQGDKIPVAQTVDSLIDHVNKIVTAPGETGISDKQKLGVIQMITDPQNRGVLGGDTFKNSESRMRVFNKLTNQSMTEEIYRVTHSKDAGPEGLRTWANYEAFTQVEWGTQLYGPAIKQLSSFTAPNGTRIGWNDKEKQFKLLDVHGNDITNANEWDLPTALDKTGIIKREADQGRASLQQFQPILRQVNMGLQNIVAIARAKGDQDANGVDAYVMNFLTQAGFNPTLQNATYLPEHMVKAIYNTTMRDTLLKKMKQGSQETRGAFE